MKRRGRKRIRKRKKQMQARSQSPPPTTLIDLSATLLLDKAMIFSTDEEEGTESIAHTQTADNWTDAEDAEALARHGISPNHLFGKESEGAIEMTNAGPAKETRLTILDETTTVNLTAAENSPHKKKTKSTDVPSAVRNSNRYTTKSFSVAKTAHKHSHPRTYVEASITLTKEDKPKEFIASIKLLLSNGQILDPNFLLAPLKHDEATKKPKLITVVDDVPVNFTHLGQYAYTSGNRIFEKKKDWKGEHNPPKKAPHRDNMTKEEIFHDPIV